MTVHFHALLGIPPHKDSIWGDVNDAVSRICENGIWVTNRKDKTTTFYPPSSISHIELL